ncbi:MAG TPA: protein-glutamate O-methyltransferase CheR [Clostridiales bacterium]|jgi:chemotaxis protein methyltransferase CheR|nr:protein-glutamate O-methyltransferase CheR [Clostridiales bacterium]
MHLDIFTNPAKLTDREFKELKTFVYDKYGIDLSRKRQLVEARLASTLRTKGLKSFEQYLKLLKDDKTGEEITTFLNRITTNYSYFAREADHFDFLAKTVLPQLARRSTRELRIWSAGCSSGQEPYTIAMVIDQYFGEQKRCWDTAILATDISTNVLAKAQAGIYPSGDLDNLPPIWKSKYFTRVGEDSYQVIPEIRKEVIYKVFNLMDPIIFKKPFDIIFCRNVMIYFDKQTTNQLIERFYNATAEGGYLFIGHSETIDRTVSKYKYIQPAVYQKPFSDKDRA